ncbi:MAG: bifunctional folylpolyglutamate synthase/dihydrofolate synthase [Methanomassiliicoccaceae archaeon]|nr:bifunctional folylpolyglutamate synthase/dihydrofolate synthase [Methanomassiliicoccaceae archaeon]
MYGLGMNRMRFGLDNITELLRRLGDPQKKFRSVHIAGSDGKGSTCAMIYSILLNAGVKAGMYTSPHLIRFNERISVNGDDISDTELEDLMFIVRPVADRMLSEGTDCTFFEVATALAFLHFSRTGVEYAVLETGMGGRLDATNTVIPEITAITHISVEHAEILGNTVEKIAFEKAGIIKRNVPVVTANIGNAFDVIGSAAKKNGSEVIRVGDPKITSFANGYVTMNYSGDAYEIGIPGRCQAENAAVAIECVKRIEKVTPEHISKGLKDVRWRGRMEYFPADDIIVDVTHTADGAQRLADDVLETYGKVTLILGMFSDKSADGICRSLSRISSRVIVTAPDSERAMPPGELMGTMKRYSDSVSMKNNLRDAIDSAKGKGTVLITGSLHMAGEAISYLRR